jgi:hypothetical protein
MAITSQKAKKTGIANEYSAVYFGDQTKMYDKKEVVSPIFIQILRRHLVTLKALKLVTVPAKTYTTKAGLTVKYVEIDKVIWKNTTGKIGTVEYNNSEPVTPLLHNQKLELTLIQTEKNNKGLTVHKKITIGVPISANAAQVAAFIQPFSKALVKSKFGDSVTNFQFEIKDRAKNGSVEAVAPWYIPMGVNTVSTGLTNALNVGKKSKTIERLVVASIRNAAAEALGFTKAVEASQSDIDVGSKFGRTVTAGSNKLNGFSVFQKPACYSQIWDDVNYKATGTQTPIASPGTGITVKCRFTTRKNATFGIGGNGGKIKAKSSSVSFLVPIGTPKGMILEFLMQCLKRPRSFQMGNNGKAFGVSIALPSRNAAAK